MLDKIGYLHIKNYFDPEKISLEADKTVKTSQKIKWNYIKVFWDKKNVCLGNP